MSYKMKLALVILLIQVIGSGCSNISNYERGTPTSTIRMNIHPVQDGSDSLNGPNGYAWSGHQKVKDVEERDSILFGNLYVYGYGDRFRVIAFYKHGKDSAYRDRLVIDFNRDGNLADETPIPVLKEGESFYIVFHLEGGDTTMRASAKADDRGGIRLNLSHCNWVEGMLPLGNKMYRFAIVDTNTDGYFGAETGDTLLIDINEDGRFDLSPYTKIIERYNICNLLQVKGQYYRVIPTPERLTIDWKTYDGDIGKLIFADNDKNNLPQYPLSFHLMEYEKKYESGVDIKTDPDKPFFNLPAGIYAIANGRICPTEKECQQGNNAAEELAFFNIGKIQVQKDQEVRLCFGKPKLHVQVRQEAHQHLFIKENTVTSGRIPVEYKKFAKQNKQGLHVKSPAKVEILDADDQNKVLHSGQMEYG